MTEAASPLTTRIKRLFLESWRGKLATLLIAWAIWYLIKSHLDKGQQDIPVPGTTAPVPARSSTSPGMDDTLLNPLSPPVPGIGGGN